MGEMLPPIIIELIASAESFTLAKNKVIGGAREISAAGATTSERLSNLGAKASTMVVAAGAGIAILATKMAFDFQEGMDKIKNQTNITQGQLNSLGNTIQNLSSQTGLADKSLQSASLAMLQSGVSGAKGVELLTAASKAAVITGTDVTAVTRTLIAAQTLQVAKGMDVTKMTGILVKGSKLFQGGLSAEENMLNGRVGVALAKYGLRMKQIIPIGAEFAKVGLPSRAIAGFVNSLGNLDKPTTDSKGKMTAFASSLKAAGLNQEDLASKLRRGDLVGVLKEVRDASGDSSTKLTQLATTLFGTAGSGTASVLIKNLTDIGELQKNMSGAGVETLNTSFADVTTQLGPQLNILKQTLNNMMIDAGKLLLPVATDILQWIGGFAKLLRENPLLKDVFGVGAIAIFGLAIAAKIKSAFTSIMGLFNKGAQVVATSANTVALEENTAALLGKSGTGLLPKAEKYGKFGLGIGDAAAVATLGLELYAVKKQVLDPFKNLLENTGAGGLNPAGTYPTGSIPTSGTGKNELYNMPYGQMLDGQFLAGGPSAMITKAQEAALEAWSEKNNIFQTSSQYSAAINNFASQDQKGNYSVTVRVK
jgi:hypothetical protein